MHLQSIHDFLSPRELRSHFFGAGLAPPDGFFAEAPYTGTVSRSHSSSKPRGSTKRKGASPPRTRYGWLSLAADIYARVRSSKRTMDAEVASILRGQDLPEAETGFALDTAYGMLRRVGFLERCARLLPFAPTREAKVALYLLWSKQDEHVPLGDGERRAAERAIEAATTALSQEHVAFAIAACTPVPAWLCEKWLQEKGEAETRRLCEGFAQEPPITLRVNRLRTTTQELQAHLLADGISTHPTRFAPDGLQVARRVPLTRTAWFQDGHFERQDEGSQLLSALCEAKPGMRVIDICAGAGGKTLHLAAQMENKGTLFAADIHTSRLRALKARAKRAGVWNLQICELNQSTTALDNLRGQADVLLVDAPCSGSGTLRRAPDIGWRLSKKSIPRLVSTQLEILEQHHSLVRPGGRLVYATCSVLEEEGPEVVARFLSQHPDFELLCPQSILSSFGIQIEAEMFLQLRPDLHDTDGFFAAVLQRRAPLSLA